MESLPAAWRSYRAQVRVAPLGYERLPVLIRTCPQAETVAMATWDATTTVRGEPRDVLEVLTDPDNIRRWSPIEFRLEQLAGDRLAPGSRARVAGGIAGRRVKFDIEVIDADERGLVLRAVGPIEIDVEYLIEALEDAAAVTASVSVRSRGGLVGRLLSGATDGLLAAGALQNAVARIAREVEARPCALAA